MAEAVVEIREPFIQPDGALVIPLNCRGRFRHWERETAKPNRKPYTIAQILHELNAPLATWKRHGYEADLSEEPHRKYCKGEVRQGDGFNYCVECARYQINQ